MAITHHNVLKLVIHDFYTPNSMKPNEPLMLFRYHGHIYLIYKCCGFGVYSPFDVFR